MPKIAVFDSGLGSVSIIRPIQKIMKSEIIYFADQKNFPYGIKNKTELGKIIKSTINLLNEKFKPDLIVVGSNTPTIVLKNLTNQKILGVFPPLKKASEVSKTKNIAVLATQLVINSKEFSNFIKQIKFISEVQITKIDGSSLIQLVESGKFLTNPKKSRKIIKKILEKTIYENNIDVITLSSTHLPFLFSLLKKEFPTITFLDPANDLAKKIAKKLSHKKSNKNKIKIYTSKNPRILEKQLQKIGIKQKVNFLSLPKI